MSHSIVVVFLTAIIDELTENSDLNCWNEEVTEQFRMLREFFETDSMLKKWPVGCELYSNLNIAMYRSKGKIAMCDHEIDALLACAILCAMDLSSNKL